jgi:PAS domain-containing protein
MSVNLPQNPDLINRQLDYILIAGLLPFFLVGEWLVQTRYAHMTTFATALIEEVKVAQENKKRAAAKAAELGTADAKKPGPKVVKKDDKKDPKAKDPKAKDAAKAGVVKAGGDSAEAKKKEAEAAAAAAQKAALQALDQHLENDEKKRNTRLNLPKILQDYNAGITTIEIVSRILWHSSDDKDSLEAAASLLDAADKAYPEVPYVKVIRVSNATSLASDPSVHLPKLDIIKKMEPGILSRYYVYKRTVDIRDRTKVSKSEGENSLDLVAYIEFQNLFTETKRYNDRAIEAIRDFWLLFLQKSITATAFNRASREIDIQAQKAALVYKTMLSKFSKNPQVLTSYAYFLDLVLRNTEEAQRSIRRADEQKAREAEEARSGNVAGQIDSQAVVAISEDGSIEQVNKVLLELFGYSRKEILGRNVKLIVPSPWKEHHDGILSRYRKTGIAKVIGVTQT